MKIKYAIMAVLGAASVAMATLHGEEPAKQMTCCCMKKAEESKKLEETRMKQMQQEMKAEAAELDKLVDEMNASTGEKKIEAMAAIINKMVQHGKAMRAGMGGMMMIGVMKKDGKPADVDYYTCKLHPSVRSQDPKGKCPICSMNLVPVYKKSPAAKPKEEIKKAEDPHAHH